MSGNESDSDSSDSSNEFMVSPDKIKSLSPFFAKTVAKKPAVKKTIESSEESDFEDANETHHGNNDELMAQVLKNLEAVNKNNNLSHDSNTNNSNDTNIIKSPKKELTNEIADLLLLGESGATASTSNDNHDESEEDSPAISAPSEYTIPKEGVKITLTEPSLIFNQRKAKKQETLQDLLKKKLNQQLRSNQVLLHKVGLLCWLAHGFYVNKQINNPILLSSALKFAPKNCYPKGRADLAYLEKITKWFIGMFDIAVKKPEPSITTLNLLKRLRDKEVHSNEELVLLYVATLRALGLTCRLVISLQPPALKVARDQLIVTEVETKVKTELKKEGDSKSLKNLKKEGDSKISKNSKSSKIGSKQVKEEKKNSPSPKSPVKQETEKSNISARLRKATEARKRAADVLKRKKDHNSSENSSDDLKPPAKKLALRRGTKTVEPVAAIKSKGRTANTESKEEEEGGVEKSGRTLRSRGKTAAKHFPKNKNEDEDDEEDEYKMSDDEEEDEDEDEEVFSKPKRKSSVTTQASRTKAKGSGSRTKAIKKESRGGQRRNSATRKLISSDDEYEAEEKKPEKVKKGRDLWVEVYVESEENWISVNVPDGKIHCTTELYKKATDPVLYVMAWNSEGQVRDVTRRYCPHWLTVTRKQRIDEKWWLAAHTPWKEPESSLTKAEDEMLKQKELEQPLPKTVSECKGHPLYVLPRHLLKFEALYPPDVVPLGYVRGEPIYSRHCVHTLCSRETWVKNARVVKPGEICYKVVKARPKYDKLSGARLKDESLEVFGKWQTDQYVPPEAKNGIVPRNEYGNVDLFKECMLPKGTVHIQLPALNRIARKLDIDCAPAVVGFNFGGHGALPAFDGYIVCEEFEDVLREAWEVEQVEADKRAKEKYEKRVYGNWRKLIKAALIRERLTAKYDFNNEEEKKLIPANKPTNKRIKQTRSSGKKAKV